MSHQDNRWEQESKHHTFVDEVCTNCGITEKWLRQLIYPEDPWELNALPYCRNEQQAIDDAEEYDRVMNKVDYRFEVDR